jgi:UDP-glucuronate 4-epimerase
VRRAIGASFERAADALLSSQRAGTSAPKVVLVTGTAGFVGFHAAKALRLEGHGVVGLDNFNTYYSISLKRARAAALDAAGVHTATVDLTDADGVRMVTQQSLACFACPDAPAHICVQLRELLGHCSGVTHVLHLAAQAGVRYAVKNPAA